MPVATDHRTPMRRQPGTAPRLAHVAAMLSGAAREIAQPPGDPECIHDLRCAIRHLEQTCDSLAAGGRSRHRVAAPKPATGWHLVVSRA
jgi:hypothetical protein